MNNIWLYWETVEFQQKPGYIELCHEIVKAKSKHAEVHLVTPENLSHYLPVLPENLNAIRFNNTGKPSIALKTDYIRAALLQRYGGLWLDSDCIVLQDLSVSVLSLLQEYEFIAMRKTCQANLVTNNFFASRPNGKIINAYLAALEKLLQTKEEFSWLELGAELLTPIVNRYQTQIKFMEEKLIHPISYTEADILFKKPGATHCNGLISEQTLMVMLYNDLFNSSLAHMVTFKKWPISQILQADIYISEIFRKAVSGMSKFENYDLMHVTKPMFSDERLSQFKTLADVSEYESYEKIILDRMKKINEYENELAAIVNSVAWQRLQLIRKFKNSFFHKRQV